MTAFEYMATLRRLKDVIFREAGGLKFAWFTVENDFGFDRKCIVTEERGEAYECTVPHSMEEMARMHSEPERMLALARRPVS